MTHPHQHHLSPDTHDPPDQWHKHTPEEKPQSPHGEVANAPVIMLVGLGSFLIVVATIILTYGYYTWYTTKLLDQVEGQDPAFKQYGQEANARNTKLKAQSELQGYNWVQAIPPVIPEGTVQIPVEKAAAKVVKVYTQKK
jgi:hypothetical protein